MYAIKIKHIIKLKIISFFFMKKKMSCDCQLKIILKNSNNSFKV